MYRAHSHRESHDDIAQLNEKKCFKKVSRHVFKRTWHALKKDPREKHIFNRCSTVDWKRILFYFWKFTVSTQWNAKPDSFCVNIVMTYCLMIELSLTAETAALDRMKAVIVLLVPLLLPLVSAQTFRWGPCPTPMVQPNFELNKVGLCKYN